MCWLGIINLRHESTSGSHHIVCLVQAQDYRIQYDSIVRIFVLPKSHTPHTLVVISLDPPIRKGQTFYQHILVQLPTDETLAVDLEITEEQLAEKNEKVSCPAQ